MRTKSYRVGLSGIKTIVGLILSGIEAKLFSWYDMRDKTKLWWHGCSDREAPLAVGMGVEAVAASERWYNDVGRQWIGST